MKKYKFKKGTTISHLHEKLILDILCFLPAKSIIRCSCVCKDWANLIDQPSFPHIYFSRGKAPLQLVLERGYSSVVLAQFDEASYTAKFPSNFSIPKKLIFDIDMRRIFDIPSSFYLNFHICQVTGWILALSHISLLNNPTEKQLYRTFRSGYHMYNPITGQLLVVQKATRDDDVPWYTGALVFAQTTNQLKLLGFYRKKRSGRAEVYIQTIGTNTWRRIDELPHSPGRGQPITLNRLCHWLNQYHRVIFSFDPEKEIFQVIKTPPYKVNSRPKLGSLDGCLCLSLTKSRLECEIWVMHEYGVQDSWTKKFVISDVVGLRPLACLKNGEILMQSISSKTVRYDWETHPSMICFNPSSTEYRHVGIRKSSKKKTDRRIGLLSG